MKNLKLSAAVLTILTLTTSSVMAEAWDVSQTTTPGGTGAITQTGTTASLQSLNTVNSSTATINGSQTVARGTNDLSLSQTGATATSTQATNYVASVIDGLTTAFTQGITGTSGAIALGQNATGTGNLQGVNIIELAATQGIGAATQTISTEGAFGLTQSSGTSVQTGNGVITHAAQTADGAVTQEASTGALTLNQTADSSTQATNYLGARR